MQSIFIEDIECVLFETTQASISICLLTELVKKGIRIVFCDTKYNPFCELSSYYGSTNTTEKLLAQCKWSEYGKNSVWTKIENDKIISQKQLLSLLNIPYNTNKKYTEATFAAIYFKKLFGKNFIRFLDDDINSALNYGYTLLLSKMNRIIILHGYSTQLGIHHNNKHNNYNLACDFIEPFRPIVDKMVYKKIGQPFNTEYKHTLQTLLQEKIKYNGQYYTVAEAMDLYFINIIKNVNDNITDTICLEIA